VTTRDSDETLELKLDGGDLISENNLKRTKLIKNLANVGATTSIMLSYLTTTLLNPNNPYYSQTRFPGGELIVCSHAIGFYALAFSFSLISYKFDKKYKKEKKKLSELGII